MEDFDDCEKVKDRMGSRDFKSVQCCDLCHQNGAPDREHEMTGMIIYGDRFIICCQVMDRVIKEEGNV